MLCAICYNSVKNFLCYTNCQCQEVYHEHCLSRWNKVNKSCPTCRKKYKQKPNLSQKPNLPQTTNLNPFLLNYNILRIMSGMSGLSYS